MSAVCLLVFLSFFVSLCVCLSAYVSVSPSSSLSLCCLSVYLSVKVSVCLFVWKSVGLSVSFCLSVSDCVSVELSTSTIINA